MCAIVELIGAETSLLTFNILNEGKNAGGKPVFYQAIMGGLQEIGLIQVIVEQPGEVASRSQSEQRVHIPDFPQVAGMVDDADARIGYAEHLAGQHFSGIIIADDNFEIGETLGEDRLEGLPQQVVTVIGRHADGEKRLFSGFLL